MLLGPEHPALPLQHRAQRNTVLIVPAPDRTRQNHSSHGCVEDPWQKSTFLRPSCPGAAPSTCGNRLCAALSWNLRIGRSWTAWA